MALSSSQEERFSAILQPIRDLARNWDIDIAHHLEDYLDDLEKIEITFDDGSTTMNFSEAALLIQGSAGVYAKKVEYLYSLVFQVLDLVQQKKKQKGKAGEGDENGGDNENGLEDEQFLELDDEFEETEASYMKEQDDFSLNKSVRPMPQMPSCLIPLEEAQKGNNPICNHKGEVVGNYFDFLINSGHIGADSAISLELGDAALLHMATLQQGRLMDMVGEDLSGCRGDQALPEPDDHEDMAEPEDFPGEGADVADDRDMGDNCNNNAVAGEGTEAEQLQKRSERLRRSKNKRVTFARPQPRPIIDPWKLLDPHACGKAAEKPIRKKIPYKIPAGLEDTTSKKRKIKKEIKKELPPIDEVVEKIYSHRPCFPKVPFKIPEFPELDEAFWKEFKVRERVKKEEIKMLKKEEQLEEQELAEDVEEGRAEEEFDFPHNGDDDDDFPVLQLESDVFGVDHGRRTLESGYPTDLTDDMAMSYEELVKRHVEQFLASASEYAQLTDLSKKVSEWEERIKPRLEEEGKHEAFDIHKYGTRIIEQLNRGGEARPFRDLVKGKEQFQICRYTLATLQLANAYNVELTVPPGADGNIVDTLHVKLLNTKRHFEELEDYMAPSSKDTT